MILDLLKGIYYVGGIVAIFVAIFILRKKVIKLMDENDELRIKISTKSEESGSDDEHYNQSSVEKLNDSSFPIIGLIAVTRTPFGLNVWKWFSKHQYGFVLIPELISTLDYAVDINKHLIRPCRFYYFVPDGDERSYRYSKRVQTIGGSLTLSCIPVVEVWTDRTLCAAEQYADLFEKMMIGPLHILSSNPFPELDKIYKVIRGEFISILSVACLVHPYYRDVNVKSHISQEIPEEAWRKSVVQEKEETKSKAYIIHTAYTLQQLFEDCNLKTRIADIETGMTGDVISNVTLIRHDVDPNTIIVLKDNKE